MPAGSAVSVSVRPAPVKTMADLLALTEALPDSAVPSFRDSVVLLGRNTGFDSPV